MENLTTIISWFLCFIAASLSSAGGVGGGSLYLPILNLLAGLDLKTATTFSAFMVFGGSLSNVLYNLFFRDPHSKKSFIDYEIALLSEPCMLLGVSIGVVCNVMFPEWLITVLFAIFLGLSTFKTCKAGCQCWKSESDEVRRVNCGVLEGENGMEEGLLGERDGEGGLRIPWGKLGVLLMVWFSFFLLHLLIGDKGGKSMFHVTRCGFGYWLITFSQVPLAIAFTSYILYNNRRLQVREHNQEKDGAPISPDVVLHNRIEALPMVVFPLAALLSGIVGGLLGIGGGLLINPLLLQIGVPPQMTAATTCFMVLFSSSMSLVQYLILGMKHIKQASVFATICFVASIVGLLIVQRAIAKSGRASLIVFSVSTVMALSTVSITCFGAVDVWREYASGKGMGFKLPC